MKTKVKKVLCYDIRWKTDGKNVDLPKHHIIDIQDGDDPADILSADFGWLVNSFSVSDIEYPQIFNI